VRAVVQWCGRGSLPLPRSCRMHSPAHGIKGLHPVMHTCLSTSSSMKGMKHWGIILRSEACLQREKACLKQSHA